MPAQPVVLAAEVAAGEVEEVEQQPERGGDGEGRGPAREQRQGEGLQVAGPRQAAQVPRLVAQHGQQLASSSLGRSTVPAQRHRPGRVGGVLQLVGGHGVETLDHGHAGGHQLLQLLRLGQCVRRRLQLAPVSSS